MKSGEAGEGRNAKGFVPVETEVLMTVHETAEFLRVTPATVRQMVLDGRLESALEIPAGKRVNRRFRKSDLLKQLSASEV